MALGAEKVTNGGFPSATTGWTAGGSALLASVSGGQTGNCLRITENGEANPYGKQIVVGIAGKTYKFVFYVKQGTEATYRAYVTCAGGSTFGLNMDTEATSEHIKHTFTFTNNGTGNITIYLQQRCGAAAGTNIYFDEVSLKLIGAFARDGVFMGMGIEM